MRGRRLLTALIVAEDGSGPAGPEPWEFVWIGSINISCVTFTATEAEPFCDTIGSTFEDDIDWLLDSEITTGCRVGRFCTSTAITRAEVATMIWRYYGRPPPTTFETDFADVDPSRYFGSAVARFTEEGVTIGTGSFEFSPDREISRAEFVTFLWRIAGQPPTATGPFIDVDPQSYAAARPPRSFTASTTREPARAATRSTDSLGRCRTAGDRIRGTRLRSPSLRTHRS